MTIARLKSPITGYQLITLIFTRNARPIRYLDRAFRDSQRPFCGYLSLLLSLPQSPSLSLYVGTTVAYKHTCVPVTTVPFLELVCASPIPNSQALSRNHIRICDHVTAYRLDFVSNTIHTRPPPAPSGSNAFRTDVPARDSARRFGYVASRVSNTAYQIK